MLSLLLHLAPRRPLEIAESLAKRGILQSGKKPSKLMTRVRFPSPAPIISCTCAMVIAPF
jgi:hypothetical protein